MTPQYLQSTVSNFIEKSFGKRRVNSVVQNRTYPDIMLLSVGSHLALRGYLYVSKALNCMEVFMYKQKLLFYHGDGYLWPNCCMNNLDISHRSLYAPTYSF